MNNELQITGRQNFMGVDIPVVLGGFGPGKKCIADKTIAEIHGMKTFHVRELVKRNLTRFQDGVDTIDLKVIVPDDDNLIPSLGYVPMEISKAEHIYIFSERGYAKLIKIMDTDKAWEVHDKLMDEYFEYREMAQATKALSAMQQLRLQSQALLELDERTSVIEEKIERVEDKVDNQITLDHGQQRTLQAVVSKRVYERAATIFPAAEVKDRVKALFAALYRDIKNRFGVASYRDIRTIDYPPALKYVEAWVEPAELRNPYGEGNER